MVNKKRCSCSKIAKLVKKALSSDISEGEEIWYLEQIAKELGMKVK